MFKIESYLVTTVISEWWFCVDIEIPCTNIQSPSKSERIDVSFPYTHL